MDPTKLKAAVERWMAPALVHVPVHPHLVTLLALAAALAAAGFVIHGETAPAGILILASGALDLLDGAIAKAHRTVSAFGALIDRVADRVADFTVVAAFLLGGHAPLGWGLLALLCVMLGSYTSACLEAQTGSRIGESLSLRAPRVLLLALACLTQRIPEGVVLLAAVGALSFLSRLVLAGRLLDETR